MAEARAGIRLYLERSPGTAVGKAAWGQAVIRQRLSRRWPRSSGATARASPAWPSTRPDACQVSMVKGAGGRPWNRHLRLRAVKRRHGLRGETRGRTHGGGCPVTVDRRRRFGSDGGEEEVCGGAGGLPYPYRKPIGQMLLRPHQERPMAAHAADAPDMSHSRAPGHAASRLPGGIRGRPAVVAPASGAPVAAISCVRGGCGPSETTAAFSRA